MLNRNCLLLLPVLPVPLVRTRLFILLLSLLCSLFIYFRGDDQGYRGGDKSGGAWRRRGGKIISWCEMNVAETSPQADITLPFLSIVRCSPSTALKAVEDKLVSSSWRSIRLRITDLADGTALMQATAMIDQALLENGQIDEETTAALVAVARPYCGVTFHRAFDCCTTEPVAALETLIR